MGFFLTDAPPGKEGAELHLPILVSGREMREESARWVREEPSPAA